MFLARFKCLRDTKLILGSLQYYNYYQHPLHRNILSRFCQKVILEISIFRTMLLDQQPRGATMFPVLKNPVILQIMQEVNVPLSESELTEPGRCKERVREVFVQLVSLCAGGGGRRRLRSTCVRPPSSASVRAHPSSSSPNPSSSVAPLPLPTSNRARIIIPPSSSPPPRATKLAICWGIDQPSLFALPSRIVDRRSRMSHPDLFADALPEAKFFCLLSKQLRICGYHEFGFRDLAAPQAKRLRRQLSALINFLKYREDMGHLEVQALDEVGGWVVWSFLGCPRDPDAR